MLRQTAMWWLVSGLVALQSQEAVERFRLNQIGFYPHGPKRVVVVDPPGSAFSVVREGDGERVFTGTLSEPKVWPYSEERVSLADFSPVQEEGVYRIFIEGLGLSWPFAIRPHVHQRLAVALAKGFYFQRASMALEERWAGPWKRPAGHPDTVVAVHASAATAHRPTGTIIRSPKGWYDAGDYNKYIVNSGITMWSLFSAYEHFPEYVAHLALPIPECENGVPDLLDEALWNLRWMLTMQDPHDGGVYHKLTSANFCGFIMPDRDRDKRYVVQKSVTATLDFAAVMAQAARVFQGFDEAFPGLADSCLVAAEEAWGWAMNHPSVFYNQTEMNQAFDPDIYTGEYGDRNATDEFHWAALELYLTTGNAAYLEAVDPLSRPIIRVPSWPNVSTCGIISLLMNPDRVGSEVDLAALQTAYLDFAQTLLLSRQNSAYGVVMGVTQSDFVWGSNAVAANQALCLLVAYRLTGEEAYLEAALSNLDYCLGRNGTGYSFVTGHGWKTPMRIHHRPSAADGVVDPVPGLLAGGPNPGQQDGVKYPSKLPALSYVDNQNSYASNEIAINWNAPLVYVAFGIESAFSADGLPDETRVSVSSVAVRGLRQMTTYPNPFNPETTISFTLDRTVNARLTVHDLLGRTVTALLEKKRLPPGRHEVLFRAEGLPSGVYVVRLEAGHEVLSQKVFLVR